MNNKVYLPNNQWATYTNGIVVQNSRNVLVQSNYIEGTGTHWWKSGIRLDKCPGSTVRCNTSSNLGVGLFMTDEQVPVSLKQNEMINNWTGLYLGGGNVGHIGLPQGWYVANWIQNNGAYLPLLAYSASTLAWDNHWVGQFSSDDVISAGPFYYFPPNPYKIFARDNTVEWKPSPVDNDFDPNSHFEMQSDIASDYYGNYNTYNCPTGDAGTQELIWEGGDLDQYRMMLTDTTRQLYDTAYKWSQKYTVYDLLTQVDSLRNADSLFSAFFNSIQNANIGNLHKVSKGLGIISGKNIDFSYVEAYKDTLNSITPNNVPETDLISVLNFWSDVMLDSSKEIIFDSTLMDMVELDSTIRFASANTRLDSATYGLVKEIANKCPYIYGHAVYLARGLAALNDSAGVVYLSECETYALDTLSLRMEDQLPQTSNLAISDNKLYPNPTNNEVFLEYNLKEGEIGSLDFYNSLGQKIEKESNILGSGKRMISLSTFSEGIYFVRLVVNGKTRNHWKLGIKK